VLKSARGQLNPLPSNDFHRLCDLFNIANGLDVSQSCVDTEPLIAVQFLVALPCFLPSVRQSI